MKLPDFCFLVLLICACLYFYQKQNSSYSEEFKIKIDSLVRQAYIKGQVDYMIGDIRIKPDTITNKWILIKSPYK